MDKLKLIPNPTADNALIIGNTLHLALETNLDNARQFYYSSYPIISDKHIEEMMKLEILVPKVKQTLEQLSIYSHEFRISNSRFVGIVDLIVRNEDGTVDVFDFKYSNNVKNYMDSAQLHIYKYFLEQLGFKVRKLGFIFVPKWQGRMKNTEDIYHFRKRLIEEVSKLQIQIAEIKYDPNKVIEFMGNIVDVVECNEYPKNVTKLCSWCDYENYCVNNNAIDILNIGGMKNMLPKAERVEINKNNYKKIWIYGAPFSGKTTLADEAPTPLNLNTDGNVKYVTMQRLPIKDEVTVEGRISKRTFAWEVVKGAVEDLEKCDNGFETIVVDLVEDTYEHCRLFMYHKLGISHESDDGFRAWDKVRMEYLSTYKRLLNLPYNIILISHEDMSKDITKKSGDKITAIKPNINDKVATKLAGMVDIVARVVIEDDNSRTLNFKTNEVVFGGGRLKGVKAKKIPLSWDELMKVYEEANRGRSTKAEDKPKEDKPVESPRRSRKSKGEIKEDHQVEELREEVENETPKEEPKEDNVPAEEINEEPMKEEPVKEDVPKGEDKPKTKRRRKKKDEEVTEEVSDEFKGLDPNGFQAIDDDEIPF